MQLPKVSTVVRVTEFLLAGEPVRADIKFNVHLHRMRCCQRSHWAEREDAAGKGNEDGLDGHGRKMRPKAPVRRADVAAGRTPVLVGLNEALRIGRALGFLR